MSILAQLADRIVLSLKSSERTHILILMNNSVYIPGQTYGWYRDNCIQISYWTPMDSMSLAEKCMAMF